MSRIIVPSRRIWTRQPQRPARVDRDFLGFNPEIALLGSIRQELSSNKPVTWSSAMTQNVNSAGVGFNQNNVASGATITGTRAITTSKCTFVAVLRRTASNPYNCVARLSTSGGYLLANNGNGTGIGIAVGGIGDGPNLTLQNNVTYVVVASMDGSTYYVTAKPLAGGAVIRTSGSFTEWDHHNGTAVVLPSASPYAFAGEVYMIAAGFAFIPESKARLILDNPFRCFKPRTRRTSIDLGAGSGTNTSLTISEALHAHNVDALLLSWQDLLTVSDSNHAHTADSLTLSTQWLLAVQEALHAHAADNIGLSATGSASLSVQDSTHAHLADALTLVTTWLLSVADSKHGHAADNLTLDTSNATWLTVQESFHAHTADNVALTLDTWLAIVDAAHAHYADAQTITVDASLAVAEALHAVYSESVRLGIPGLYVRAPNGPGYRRLMINVTRPKQRNTVRH